MPTATGFASLMWAPGIANIESKTTAQLNAINSARWEGTEAEVCALVRNLYTVDIRVQYGTWDGTNTSIPFKLNSSGGATTSDLALKSDATPNSRDCADLRSTEPEPPVGIATGAYGTETGGNDECTAWMSWVYYNSTTGKYAVLFNVFMGYGDVGLELASWQPSTGVWNVNGGVVTILGQVVPTTYKYTGLLDSYSVTISNPVYYTY